MRILYTVPSYPTGKHHGFLDEIECLINEGHTIGIAPIWKSNPDLKVDKLPLRIIYNPNSSIIKIIVQSFYILTLHPSISLNFIKQSLKYLGIIESLKSLPLLGKIQSFNPQHIHSHFANNAALKVLLISKSLNIRFTCSGRGTDVLLKRIENFNYLVNNSQPFITISYYNKSIISKLPGINAENIKVIHHGINIQRYPQKEWEKITIKTLISVTWLRRVKGVEYLINACKILSDKRIPIRCLIVGDGYLRETIENQIKELELEKFVFLLGAKKHNEVIKLLLNCDLFVLPSLSEGIAISAMEAMAMGLPVIATRITGMPELIDHEENGILVPPRDSTSMAKAIERLIKNPEKAIALGQRAKRKIEEQFNIKTTVKHLLSLFNKSEQS